MFLFSKDEDSPRLKQLRALSLFSTLSPRELKTADNLLHERSYLQGEVIFDQGEEGQALYIIETGKVLICRQGQQAEGKIAELGPGRLFGELALLDSQPRSADARCLAPTRLIRLRGADLDELMTNRPAATREIVRVLVKRLRETGRRMQS